MKRLTFLKLTIIFLLTPLALYAQWQPTDAAYNGDVYHLNGKVGIGTQPAELLHVKSTLAYPRISVQSTHASGAPGFDLRDAAGTARFTWHYNIAAGYMGFFQNGDKFVIKDDGKVGVGTTSPAELLHVSSTLQYPRVSVQTTHTSGAPGFDIRDASGTPKFTWQYDIGGGFMSFYQGSVGNRLVIRNDGNVGIGTTSPDAKLAVKGHIHTQEVRVDMTGSMVPDYVFEDSYNLRPLSELENYINQNKHLPEVPSATEIEANGVKLAEMNMVLLKKVEELTLYVIELKKEVDKLKAK